MQPHDLTDYQKTLTEVFKSLLIILGPDVTLIQARSIPGLIVLPDGTVTQAIGNKNETAHRLIDVIEELSPYVSKKFVEPKLQPYLQTIDMNPLSQTPTVIS